MTEEQQEVHDVLVADEEEILAELQGKTFDKEKFVYKTSDGGYQLSYKGVQLACRQFAERGEVIEIPDLAKVMYDPEDKEYVLAQVRGHRVRVDQKTGGRLILDSAIGSKRKWVKQKRKDGSALADPFFFEKAISSAECAAKRKLLPQDFILEFIKHILKGTASKPQGQPASSKPDTQKASSSGSGSGSGKTQTQKSGKSADPLGALRQQFWAVLKTAIKAKDDAIARKAVGHMTGVEKVSDLNEATLKKLGGLLRKVVDGECSIKNDDGKAIIVHNPSGDVFWPENYKAAAKKEEPAKKEEEAQGAPSAPGGGEWMF